MLKLIEGLHLTAHDRRAISQIITAKATFGKTPKKRYWIKSVEGSSNRHAVTVAWMDSDMWGRQFERVERHVVEVRP